MIFPLCDDLYDAINKNSGKDKIIDSKYLVIAAVSKRARQLVNQDLPKVKVDNENNNICIAIKELYDGKVKVIK